MTKLLALNPKEVKVICPICSSECIVATDLESAKEKKIYPGIYCAKDKSHVNVMFNIKAN